MEINDPDISRNIQSFQVRLQKMANHWRHWRTSTAVFFFFLTQKKSQFNMKWHNFKIFLYCNKHIVKKDLIVMKWVENADFSFQLNYRNVRKVWENLACFLSLFVAKVEKLETKRNGSTKNFQSVPFQYLIFLTKLVIKVNKILSTSN